MSNQTEKKDLPQFGKINFVKDEVFGDTAYRNPRGFTTSPAIQANYRTWKTVEVKMSPLAKVTPFSSGSEFDGWSYHNCDQCKKQGKCALESRLLVAYVDDGKIPFKTAERIGCRVQIQSNGVNIAKLGTCKEMEQ